LHGNNNKTLENCAPLRQDKPRSFDVRRPLTQPVAGHKILTAVWDFMAVEILAQ